MNNQAAQTMPETLKAIADNIDRLAFSLPAPNAVTPELVGQAIHLRTFAAALSQTAGVADGCVAVPREPTGDMLDAMLAPWLIGNKTQRECLTEGYRAMIVAAQSNDSASHNHTRDTYRAQPGSPEFDGADAFEHYLRQIAAPAASGGEDDHG